MADSLERSSCELVIECQRLSYNIGEFHSSIHLFVSYQDCKRERSGWQEEFRDKRAQFFWLWQWQAGDSLPALLTPFERQQHFSLATGLPQFPAICGLYKHSSTRVQRVALDWLRNNIQYYILLQSFFTINNNSIYILNLMTIHIPCTRHTWSIKSPVALQQCEVIALHSTQRIPKSEQPSTVLTHCNCHKYP